MIDVSVIIVNFNTRSLLKACLEKVYAEGSPLELEVIVIDNGSSDESVSLVQEVFPRVRLVVNAHNEGFARPNNLGMRMSEGQYVFLLNSDTEIARGALGRLCAFMDAHPEAGACGPRLEFPDGTLQRSVKGFPGLWTHVCDMLLLDSVFPRSPFFGSWEMKYFPYERTAEVDHLMAAAFLVRREVLATVGMLDEQFSIYYNDMDWCYRMKNYGWKVYYVHDATVMHHLGRTIGELNRDFSRFDELYNNTMLFYQKRYGSWAVIIYKMMLAVGFLPRSILWTVRRMVERSDYSRMMMTFSWKSLSLGLRFWVPLPYTDKL